jgi:hypothetical protein
VNVNNHTLVFGWSYSDEDIVFRSEGDAITIACEAARRCQLEDYWNLVHGRSSASAGSGG